MRCNTLLLKLHEYMMSQVEIFKLYIKKKSIMRVFIYQFSFSLLILFHSLQGTLPC